MVLVNVIKVDMDVVIKVVGSVEKYNVVIKDGL